MTTDSFTWFANVACTLDGIIGVRDYQLLISNEEDWSIVHQLRHESAAVIIGAGTVMTDNPSLMVKREYISDVINQPLRVVFDRSGRLNKTYKIFKDQDIAKTIWITDTDDAIDGIEKLPYTNVKQAKESLQEHLLAIDIRRKVMVEGGSHLLNAFLNEGLITQLRIFRSSQIQLKGIHLFREPIGFTLSLLSAKKMGDGIEEQYQVSLI